MLADIKEIIIAVITVIGVVLSALIAKGRFDKKKDTTKEVVVKKNRSISLQSFGKIANLVKLIYDKTSADRFLILMAQIEESKAYVTVFYEHHDPTVLESRFSNHAIEKFINFKVDPPYFEMLQNLINGNAVEYKVSDMMPCDLKGIYMDEKVKYSKLYPLYFEKGYFGEKKDLFIYSSVAKHKEPSYLEEEKVIFRYSIGQIADLVKLLFEND